MLIWCATQGSNQGPAD